MWSYTNYLSIIYIYISTPDKPIHCIVWAKELHKLLFGVQADSTLWDGPATSSNAAEEGDTMVPSESVYMDVVNSRPVIDGSPTSTKALDDYCSAVFHAIFNLEVSEAAIY